MYLREVSTSLLPPFTSITHKSCESCEKSTDVEFVNVTLIAVVIGLLTISLDYLQRDKLLTFLEETAKGEADWEECVPYVKGTKRGKVYEDDDELPHGARG